MVQPHPRHLVREIPNPVTTFSTASRALPAAPARRGPSPHTDRELETRSAGDGSVRECERDHQGQGLSGEWAGAVRAGGVDEAAPSGRKPSGAAGRRRAAVPASRRPVVARSHAGFRHRAWPISAGDPSNGADDSFAVEERRLVRQSPVGF